MRVPSDAAGAAGAGAVDGSLLGVAGSAETAVRPPYRPRHLRMQMTAPHLRPLPRLPARLRSRH